MSLTPPKTSPFRSDLLKGKVALVTGGSSGIGYEISRQFGLHGAAVVITGRREKVLQEAVAALAAERIAAKGLQGDVRKSEDAEKWAEQTVSHFGRLDILVNSAAGNFLVPAEALSANGFRTVLDIDALGTFVTSRAALPALKASGSGCIINISTTLHYGATWWQVHVGAAKAAVDALTRSFALEWGEYGIRANGIAPGIVVGTPGVSKLSGTKGSHEEMLDFMKTEIPLGKPQTTWDMGMTAVFLASDAARSISGDTIIVDGGSWLWKPARIPREAVSQISRKAEATSRNITRARL